jgi:hypothetical protein
VQLLRLAVSDPQGTVRKAGITERSLQELVDSTGKVHDDVVFFARDINTASMLGPHTQTDRETPVLGSEFTT